MNELCASELCWLGKRNHSLSADNGKFVRAEPIKRRIKNNWFTGETVNRSQGVTIGEKPWTLFLAVIEECQQTDYACLKYTLLWRFLTIQNKKLRKVGNSMKIKRTI